MSTPLAARYSIRRKLGEGGMAEVLEAVAQGDAGFTRRVAIKRLLANHAEDPAFSRMFLDEARIASQLHHSGIVGVLDYGVVDGTPFQILEFVDGENARQLVERATRSKARMPLAVALHLVTEIARALHYAHTSTGESGASTGVVHRDVKPSNILVSRAGDIKLSDFGIAFAIERTERTMAGIAKGTPGYMAPEQMLGGAVDARADVFALGCTLHALAFGESPLARPGNVERLMSQGELELDADLPEDVAAILRRAIAPLPSKRYATAAAMAEDLGAALQARLHGDAKGALLAWLESLGEARTPTASLDALLMPEALLENEGGAWKMESTVRELAVIAPKPVEAPPPPPPRRSARGMALALGGLVIVIGGALGIAKWSTSTSTTTSASTTTIASTSASASASASTTATTITSEVATLVPSASTLPVTHAHTTVAVATVSSAPSSVVGTLAIRGGTYRGATVSIDGKVAPYGAPHFFDLPIGKHAVELRREGAVVASGNVDVRADHTPTTPLLFP